MAVDPGPATILVAKASSEDKTGEVDCAQECCQGVPTWMALRFAVDVGRGIGKRDAESDLAG
eukprot:10827520-Alexandrium_andersonii.AAC.1